MRLLAEVGLCWFQSTPPERGATRSLEGLLLCPWVSIHAPREGSDRSWLVILSWTVCFNPRPPRGERRQQRDLNLNARLFQSTPPERGATT